MSFIHRVQGIVVMRETGSLFFAKYFTGPSTPLSSQKLASYDAQRDLEESLFGAIDAISGSVRCAVVKGHLVVAIKQMDLLFCSIGDEEENYWFLKNVLQTLVQALNSLCSDSDPGARELEENYELLILCVDELLDEGIPVDIQSSSIAGSVQEINTSNEGIQVREALTKLNQMIQNTL